MALVVRSSPSRRVGGIVVPLVNRVGRERGDVTTNEVFYRASRGPYSESVKEESGVSGGITFPGYPHLGPGNTVSGVPSGNPVDEIARLHDLAYERAVSVDDIRHADEVAIASFYHHVPTKDAFASISGLTGLSLKTAVESIFGQIYPSNSALTRHFQNYYRHRLYGGHVFKRRKV